MPPLHRAVAAAQYRRAVPAETPSPAATVPAHAAPGFTLVLVHGWPDTPRLWDAQVAAFEPQHRCVRFALPGFETPIERPARPPSLQEVVDQLRATVDAASPERPVVLLLHDWGCLFGYEFAMQHPQRVAAVVGVDIGDFSSPGFLRSLDLRAKLMIAGYQLWLALAWWLGGGVGDRMTRVMARWLRAPAAPQTVHAGMNYPYFVQWTGASGGYRRARCFDAIAHGVPMLYLYGTRKPFAFHSPAWAEALAALPGCRVLPMRTGHWVMVQAREAFNAAVLDWLATLKLPAGDNAGHAADDRHA